MKVTPLTAMASLLLLMGTNLPLSAAGLPVGDLQIQISDPTNHVWDVTTIPELQAPEFEIPDNDVVIAFSAPFGQSGTGRLSGSGSTQIDVQSPIYTGPVQGTYLANGSITSARGIAKLTLASAAKGPAMIQGKAQTVLTTVGLKMTLNSLTETATGVYLTTALATGHGVVKDAGSIVYSWTDLSAAMGDGGWMLQLALTNDAIKKVGGTATVRLDSGRTLGFTAKGTYNAKKDSTVLVLAADALSKGSSLRVTLTSTNTVVLKGKLTGQTVNAFAGLAPN